MSSTHSPSVFPSGAPAVLAVLAALALQSCACCACCELPSDATADQHGSCTQMSMLRHQALYKTLRNGMDKQTQLGQVLHDTEQSCGQDAGGGSTGFHTFAAAAAMVDRRDQCDWLPLLLSLSPRQVAGASDPPFSRIFDNVACMLKGFQPRGQRAGGTAPGLTN